MSAAAAEDRKWTVAEYLAMEAGSRDKHEFFEGEIFAMASASPEHNLIVTDLLYALTGALRGKCRVYASDLRLFLSANGMYTYDDASVVCGDPEFTGDNPPSLRNPERRSSRCSPIAPRATIAATSSPVTAPSRRFAITCLLPRTRSWWSTMPGSRTASGSWRSCALARRCGSLVGRSRWMTCIPQRERRVSPPAQVRVGR